MRFPVATGPIAERKEIAGGWMLYEAGWAGNLQAQWFDPQFWQSLGSLEKAAAGRGSAWYVNQAEHSLVLRHYRRGGLMARWLADRYWFQSADATRPFREWALTKLLHARGLPVPEPIGARFLRQGNWYRGDLLTRRLESTMSLAQLLAVRAVSLPLWIEVGRCVRRFHDGLVFHADLNAHNILLRGNEVFLIDFDRGELRTRRGDWCDANLVRLRRSLEKISDALPPDRFTEADWHTLLAGYRSPASAA